MAIDTNDPIPPAPAGEGLSATLDAAPTDRIVHAIREAAPVYGLEALEDAPEETPGDDVIVVQPGNNVYDGMAGNDTLDFTASGATYVADLRAGTLLLGNGFPAGQLISIENVRAGSGNDRLIGNGEDNQLEGNAGNDIIYGLGGADRLFGGTGDDVIFADADDTRVDGGAGTDRLHIQGGAVTVDLLGPIFTGFEQVTGGAGDDTISGGGGGERLIGGAGNDTISGRGGNDLIYGLGGADELFGGAGNDTMWTDASDTRVDGGSGSNLLLVQQIPGMTVDLEGPIHSNFSQVRGNVGNDILLGSGAADRFIGNAGNDVLEGRGGNDVLYGLAGIDQILGGDGDDQLFFDASDTVVDGGAGFDRAFVQDTQGVTVDMFAQSIEFLQGRTGDDDITGGIGDQIAFGGAGADTFVMGAGNDRTDGGTGFDIASFVGNQIEYTITDLGGGLTRVEHTGGSQIDGRDLLSQIEQLSFADGDFLL